MRAASVKKQLEYLCYDMFGSSRYRVLHYIAVVVFEHFVCRSFVLLDFGS